MADILVKGLIGLVLVLAYLGFSFIVSVIFGRAAASANDVHPDPKEMVPGNAWPAGDLPASVSPRKSPLCGESDELMYQQVERFDDPEGDL